MKVVAIIQARTGSTRLPGKVLKDLKGKTVLFHVIERVQQVVNVDEVVVATTDLPQDDGLVEEVERIGVPYIRGSEEDVLSRYYQAAKKHQSDVVIRITSDCPVIDPHIIDYMIDEFHARDAHLVSNAGSNLSERTFPRGMDVEVFSFEALEEANSHGEKAYHREHVTPYLYENLKSISYYKQKRDDSSLRLTLDTEDDWRLIQEIYNHLYHGEHDFYLEDIRSLFQEKPQLKDLNAHVEQKKVKGQEE
ncbi:cytidylyltransferase domain-containing protein [Salimicrobium halophilum]|uniref:Spore coat polysaccharide biosynthesis protein SpsF n=1 Tax=Salimicrobium halophilum TaxID=86666 RepID=A0A1G8V3A3_9BACI|nr:glycosyltransferase family protein [Salimicrobium halophilum]SDJ60347.1 spore coat polysaccharide biosynthesis protein SpsF [Salimicrobium halophilum]